ncbi:hypothetical protein [Halobacillus aidingensis]|uniref:Uncharacterized protein n=1 Tax=Halobacillus aidingensis TaxID=240303 RepID=A0A1H0QPW5_HALAD|nr:hypothetical protein [Halobacillus aidingensis]SDP19145.1 hypothetical protein SAMN05421677_11378 [Halobacillus aidingensis]
MENLNSFMLENLEKAFMPHTSEYQRYIDFQTMRDMKQVIKGKRPVYFDLDIKELVEMNNRYIMDGFWNGVFFSAVIPKSNTFRGTLEFYGKPPKMLLGRFEWIEEEKAFLPTFLKEEFTRKKGLGGTLRDFSEVLFEHLNTYVDHMEVSGESTMFKHPEEPIFEDWDFPFLENHPDLQQEWTSLKERTEKQFRRMEELDIEEQYALETMMDKDVPDFIASFQRLSYENKENRKHELVETMYDLQKFIETLERKEEESHTQNFARSKGIIASKYNKEDENFLSRK